MLRRLVNFLFAFAIMTVLSAGIGSITGIRFSDFPSFYISAKQIQAGRAADIYNIDEQQAQRPKYFEAGQTAAFDPPYVLLWVAPLANMPPSVAKIVMDEVLIALLAASIVVLSEAMSLSGRQTLILMAAIIASGPVFEILKVSKPIPVALLGLCLSFLFLQRGDEKKGGLCIALCLLKPQEALPILALAAGARRWKFILACAAVGIALMLISLPVFGIAGFTNYLHVLSSVNAHPEIVGVDTMPTLKGQLLRLSVPVEIANLIGNGVFALALVALAVLGHIRRDDQRWWIAAIPACYTLGLATVPYMHLYDTVLLAPAACLLLQNAQTKLQKALVIIGILCFLTPFTQLIQYGYLIMNSGRINFLFLALVLLSVLAIRRK